MKYQFEEIRINCLLLVSSFSNKYVNVPQVCPIFPAPPVTVSIRFTYVLDEWTEYAWPQEPPDVSSCLACEVGLTDLVTLPFGTSQDSIR